MFEFLGEQNHFPGGAKDRFVTLFLPKGNIKIPVGEVALDQPGFPRGFLIVLHGGASVFHQMSGINRQYTQGRRDCQG
jgi:hypothetical protein